MNNPKNANFFMFLVFMFLIFISNLILLGIKAVLPSFITVNNIWILQILFSFTSFFIPILILMKVKKLSFKDIIPIKKLSLKNIILIIIISFIMQPTLQLISGITNIFFQDQVSDSINIFTKFSYPIVLLVIGVTPALFEELAFRGVILTGFKKSGIFIAIFMSGLYFGMMHLTMTQFFYTLVCGMFFAFLVEATGSILSSMLSHFILNSSQMTLAYISNNILHQTEPIPTKLSFIDILPYVYSSLISLPFLIFFIYLFIRLNKDCIKNLNQKNREKTKTFTAFFFVNIIIYILYMLITIKRQI